MQTIVSTFENRTDAEAAVQKLVAAGFDRDDIHVQDQASFGDGVSDDSMSGTTTGASTSYSTNVSTADDGGHDRGVLSSIGHFFTSLFDNDTSDRGQAHRYSEAVRRGNAVVVFDADDEEEADRAASILSDCGAVDIDERAEQWRATGWKDDDTSMGNGNGLGAVAAGAATPTMPLTGARTDMTTSTAATGAQPSKLDVVQEELQVGKRTLDRGGVRVVQRVSSTPVREMVQLREERAVVERRPVDRAATGADLANFQEGTIEVRESVEEPVVAKTARVVEEVVVGKRVEEHTETIEDTVRRKDVEIERIERADERAYAQGTRDTLRTDELRDPKDRSTRND